MPRDGAPARARLEHAAFDLFAEHGYERTTAAEIAARAGVTERTFFRHFADKREVLFEVEQRQQDSMAAALAAVPDDVPPLTALVRAFRARAPAMEELRPLAEARHRVITSTPALRERELAKEAALAGIVADALRRRGLSEWKASLLAAVATAALGQAVHTWVADPATDLDALIVQAFDDLRATFSAAATPRRGR